MDRRSLLKKFGIIAAVATVAPVTLASIAKDRLYPPDAPMWFASKEPNGITGRQNPHVALYNRDKELFGGGYARQPVRFTCGSSGSASNAEDVVFPTATRNWGKITHMAILEHKDGPTLFEGALAVRKDVHMDDIFKFMIGDINIDLNDGGHGIMSDGLAKRILKHVLWGEKF